MGWTAKTADASRSPCPRARPIGHLRHRRPGHEPGPHRHGHRPGPGRRGHPDRRPRHLAVAGALRWAGQRSECASHGRRPPIRPARIAGLRGPAERATAAPGPPRIARTAAQLEAATRSTSTPTTGSGSAPSMRPATGAHGSRGRRRAGPPVRRPQLVRRSAQRRPGERGDVSRRLDGTVTGAGGAGSTLMTSPAMRSRSSARRTPRLGRAKVYIDGVYITHDQHEDVDAAAVARSSSRCVLPERRHAHDHAAAPSGPRTTRSSGLMRSSFGE